MDEALRLDIAKADGKASAILCLQAALISMLVKRGALSTEEAATLAGIASQALANLDVSADARAFAEGALKGFSQSWSQLVTRN